MAVPQLLAAAGTLARDFPPTSTPPSSEAPPTLEGPRALREGKLGVSIDISGIDCPALRRLRQNPEGFSADRRAVVSATLLNPRLCRRPQPDPRRNHGALDSERGQGWG